MIPSLDFRVGCECEACQLAVLLWYGDERTHPRMAWEYFWNKRAESDAGVWVCAWQMKRFLALPVPKGQRLIVEILEKKLLRPRSVSDH